MHTYTISMTSWSSLCWKDVLHTHNSLRQEMLPGNGFTVRQARLIGCGVAMVKVVAGIASRSREE